MNMIHIGSFRRFVEIGRVFGWTDKDTWKTLFAPFKGWDVGCGYCLKESEALKLGKCERYRVMGKGSKCGLLSIYADTE